jgi:DNA-binding LacI/PurR family transcriptional regulator
MLQGALEEAGCAGYRLIVQHARRRRSDMHSSAHQGRPLRGVLFASCGEEKLLRRAAGLGLPTILLDHDLHLAQTHSVRDDSFQAARDAVQHLAGLAITGSRSPTGDRRT